MPDHRTAASASEARETAVPSPGALEAVLSTLGAMAEALSTRDSEIVGHQQRVGALSREIAGRMGFSAERILGLQIAGEMHDIGKWALPDDILRKPRRLTDAEFSIVALHATAGFNLLRHVSLPWPVAEAIHQHHERMDGSGYPSGLSGERILIEARILGVADVLDAMSSARAWRDSLGVDAALAELWRGSGTLYDADVVAACFDVFGYAPHGA